MILGVLLLLSIDALYVNIAGVNMVNAANLAHAYYVVIAGVNMVNAMPPT